MAVSVASLFISSLIILKLTLETSAGMMTTPRAAIAQLRSTSDKVANLVDIAKCAGWAKQRGVSMLFLPECFGFLGDNAQQTLANAEPPVELGPGNSINNNLDKYLSIRLSQTIASYASIPTVKETASESIDVDENENGGQQVSLLEGLRTIARQSGLWISGGGMHELGAPPTTAGDPKGRVYNTHVIIDKDGSVQCIYRKCHLFDVSIPGKVNLRESATTAPGQTLAVCDSPIGRLGLTTCYDVRFPEMYIDLVKGGAEILLVPSAFTVPTGSAHWHILLQARAIESQCYVLAAAQNGQHNAKRCSYGHSLAVNPWGEVTADAGGQDGPGSTDSVELLSDSNDHNVSPRIILCDIDLENMKSIRERMPIQQHRDSSSFSF